MRETLTWQNFIIPLIDQHCNSCHGETSVYGYLAALIYDDITTDNSLRNIIIPGNSTDSLLIITIADGLHYASFSSDDIGKTIQWIIESAKVE